MAQAGVRALAFHVPLSGCLGYSPICLTGVGAARRWSPAPEYAGLVALSTLEGDQFVRASLRSLHHHLRTYALAAPSGSARLGGPRP